MYQYFSFCRSFQTHNDGLSATWDLAGDPCPVKKQEWAAYSANREQVIQYTIIEPGTVILLYHSIKTNIDLKYFYVHVNSINYGNIHASMTGYYRIVLSS